MQPAFKAITFRRGDTPSLGVILRGRFVRSGAVVPLPRAGDVISWTIGWPGAAVTKTTAQASAPLKVDPRTLAVSWPITEADVATLAGTAIAPFVVQLVESNGRKTTYLTGTLSAQG